MDKFRQLDKLIREGNCAPKVHKRALAASMVLEDGMTHEHVSRILRLSTRSVARWTTRFEEGGVDALFDHKRPGAPRKLQMWKIVKAAARLAGTNDLTPRSLRDLLYDMYGIWYHLTHATRLLRGLGYTSKIPDVVHVNAAQPEVRRAWYRRIRRRILRMIRCGFRVMIGDEMIISNFKAPLRKRWSKKGERINIPYAGTRERGIIYGAVSVDSVGFFRKYRKSDAWHYVLFLCALMRKYRKVFLIQDGARSHNARIVREALEEYNGRLVLCNLPPGSPDMSAIERVWGYGRDFDANKDHPDVDSRIDSIIKYFRTSVPDVDVRAHLRRGLGGQNQ